MLEVTEQRPMSNEYVQIHEFSKLSRGTLTLFKAGILKLYSKFLSTLQTSNHEVNRQIFYSARFPLEWQKQLCSREVQC